MNSSHCRLPALSVFVNEGVAVQCVRIAGCRWVCHVTLVSVAFLIACGSCGVRGWHVFIWCCGMLEDVGGSTLCTVGSIDADVVPVVRLVMLLVRREYSSVLVGRMCRAQNVNLMWFAIS